MSVNIKVTGGLNIEWGQIDPKATGGLKHWCRTAEIEHLFPINQVSGPVEDFSTTSNWAKMTISFSQLSKSVIFWFFVASLNIYFHSFFSLLIPVDRPPPVWELLGVQRGRCHAVRACHRRRAAAAAQCAAGPGLLLPERRLQRRLRLPGPELVEASMSIEYMFIEQISRFKVNTKKEDIQQALRQMSQDHHQAPPALTQFGPGWKQSARFCSWKIARLWGFSDGSESRILPKPILNAAFSQWNKVLQTAPFTVA